MDTSARNSREALPTSSRYEILAKIAAGGMATVYVGRSRARGGVTRLFAVKRAHPHLTSDPIFRKMFAEEARLAARIHHPNVVAVQDVEERDDELLLILDYVEGAALADLREGLRKIEPKRRAGIATRVLLDACAGLQAAHELRDDDGRPLEMVHRDISPHNILIGVDGIARLTDFGIAKSAGHTGAGTATGGLKGKIAYMAPEYISTGKLDRRADVFALGIVLWECLTGERLFTSDSEIETMRIVAQCEVRPPSELANIPRALDEVVLTALARSPDERYPTALALSEALERVARTSDVLAQHREIGALVASAAEETLSARRQTIRASAAPGDSQPDASAPEVPSDYQGHNRTSTFEGAARTGLAYAPTVEVISSEARASQPGTLTSASMTRLSPKGKPRVNGLMAASIAMLGAAVILAGWAGARRLGRDRGVSDEANSTAAAPAWPVMPAATPSATTTATSASPAASATEEPAASADPAPRGTARPPRTQPSQTTRPTAPALPAHAPKNPYKDANK